MVMTQTEHLGIMFQTPEVLFDGIAVVGVVGYAALSGYEQTGVDIARREAELPPEIVVPGAYTEETFVPGTNEPLFITRLPDLEESQKAA